MAKKTPTPDFLKALQARSRVRVKDGTFSAFPGGLATLVKDGTVRFADPDSQVVESDDAKMRHRFLISSPAVDRAGDVVVPEGCLVPDRDGKPYLDRYRRNPIVFLNHVSTGLPLAKSEDSDTGEFGVFVTPGQSILADAYFHTETEESEVSYELIKKRFLRGASIGFRPIKGALIETKGRKVKDDEIDFLDYPGIRFDEWELLEWSVVGIPCNPDALDGFKSWMGKNAKSDSTFYMALKAMLVEDSGTSVTVSVPAALPPAGLKARAWAVQAPQGIDKHCGPGEQNSSDPCLLDVPDFRQPDNYSCGASASMEVGKFFGVGPDTIEEWKAALGTTVEKSTHPEAIVSYLRSLGLAVEARSDMTCDDLRAAWLKGAPVICPVQDYWESIDPKADFDYGHYLVVIGVALDHVFCQDSSADNNLKSLDTLTEKGRVMVDEKIWLDNWHDEDADGKIFNRYGIVVYGPAVPPPSSPSESLPPDEVPGTTSLAEEAPVVKVEPFTPQEVDVALKALEINDLEARAEARIKSLEDALGAQATKVAELEAKVKDYDALVPPPAMGSDPAPHAAKALQGLAKMIHCAAGHADEHGPLLDHHKVSPFLAEKAGELKAMAKDVHKLGRKLYPDHFPDDTPAKDHPAPEAKSADTPPEGTGPVPAVTPPEPEWTKVLAALANLTDQAGKNQAALARLTGKS